MRELFLEAQANSPLVAGQRYNYEANQFSTSSARQQFLPTPSVTTTGIDYRNATTYTLSQPLWTGGRLTAALDGAELREERARLAVEDARANLAAQIIALYQGYIVQAGRRDALKRNAIWLERLAGMIDRRIEQGASARADHELMRSRQLQNQAELQACQGSIDTTLAQWSQMLGYPVQEGMLLRAAWPELNPALPGPIEPDVSGAIPPEALATLQEAADRWYPQLQMARLDAQIAEADLRVVRSSLSPTVSLQYQHQLGAYPGSLDAGDRVMAMLSLTPGAGLAITSDLEAAQRRIQSASEAVEAQRRDLALRINAQWTDLRSTVVRLGYLAQARQTAEGVLDSSLRLFVAGQRSWLDLLNAVRELAINEEQESDARASAAGASYLLSLYSGAFIEGTP